MKIDPAVILQAIDDKILAGSEDGRRDHLGASLIGGLCERSIFYSFRWAMAKKFSARMLRLFDRGHKEEFRFEEWIRSISEQFWAIDPRTGKQIRVSDLHGYFGGSLDGVCRNPAGYVGDYLTEFKTHSVKSFDKLVMQGVKESKPEHYTQMQIYLKYQPKLTGALYVAIRKNDDEIHIEYIERDPDWAEVFVERAKRILVAIDPPAGHSGFGEFNYHCKYFCDFSELCFRNRAPDKSCRTCAFVELTESGWMCTKTGEIRDSQAQKDGCSDYERGF